jgi:uncharacterized protein with GYD domain
MAKYLFQGGYTEQGIKGIIKEGASKRREVVEQLAKSVGGKLESFYFAFGGDDFYIIVDLPSPVDAAAIALTVNASGAVRARTIVLLTAEDLDAATKKTVSYRPPGQ